MSGWIGEVNGFVGGAAACRPRHELRIAPMPSPSHGIALALATLATLAEAG